MSLAIMGIKVVYGEADGWVKGLNDGRGLKTLRDVW